MGRIATSRRFAGFLAGVEPAFFTDFAAAFELARFTGFVAGFGLAALTGATLCSKLDLAASGLGSCVPVSLLGATTGGGVTSASRAVAALPDSWQRRTSIDVS